MAKTTGLASIAEGRSDVHKVNPRKLIVKAGWNSRDFNDPDNIEYVDELARSIVAKGVMQPLTIFWEDGKAYVADGECRIRATMRAIEHYKHDIKTVPCMVEDRFANEAERLVNQYVRNTGKRFTPMEMSNHFKRLLNAGYQVKDLVEKTGLSAGRISQVLGLQILPEPVKQMVSQGQVSATLAAKTVAEQGPTQAEKALQQGWSTAVAQGKEKITPAHIETATNGDWAETKMNVRTLVKEAFEFSAVDNDSEVDTVTIRMPKEWWDKIAEELEL